MRGRDGGSANGRNGRRDEAPEQQPLESGEQGPSSFDALSSHELEWPLGVFALVVGIIWVVGRVGWWIVWKDSTKRY